MKKNKEVEITNNIIDYDKKQLLSDLRKTRHNLEAYSFFKTLSALFLIGEESGLIKIVVDNIKSDHITIPSFPIFMSYVALLTASCGFYEVLRQVCEYEKEEYLELKNEKNELL